MKLLVRIFIITELLLSIGSLQANGAEPMSNDRLHECAVKLFTLSSVLAIQKNNPNVDASALQSKLTELNDTVAVSVSLYLARKSPAVYASKYRDRAIKDQVTIIKQASENLLQQWNSLSPSAIKIETADAWSCLKE